MNVHAIQSTALSTSVVASLSVRRLPEAGVGPGLDVARAHVKPQPPCIGTLQQISDAAAPDFFRLMATLLNGGTAASGDEAWVARAGVAGGRSGANGYLADPWQPRTVDLVA